MKKNLGGEHKSRRSRFRGRLSSDFQFAMIVTFAILVLFAVTPFTLYRWHSGNITGVIANLTVMALVGAVLILVLTTKKTRLAGSLFTVVTASGVILSSLTLGPTAIGWGYLTMWVNYLLTSLRVALVLNVVLIAALAINPKTFDGAAQIASFVVTAGLVTVFGYIFAALLSKQQTQLETAALQDPLTRVGNRRLMRRDLDSAIRQRAASNRSFTLMMVDLDHFKKLNDEYGHDAGDQVLKDFAQSLRKQIRTSDGLYRFGGEEFVLLFRDTDEVVAQRLATALHQSTTTHLTGPAGGLSFSAGLAVLRSNEDQDGWLRRADHALYEAKATGRNRVVTAAEGTDSTT